MSRPIPSHCTICDCAIVSSAAYINDLPYIGTSNSAIVRLLCDCVYHRGCINLSTTFGGGDELSIYCPRIRCSQKTLYRDPTYSKITDFIF